MLKRACPAIYVRARLIDVRSEPFKPSPFKTRLREFRLTLNPFEICLVHVSFFF